MKRVLSIILATLLIVGVFPLAIFAENAKGFQTNFSVVGTDEKWNSKADGTGDAYDLLRLDYQVKGDGLSGAHGAWLAIDLTKLFLVSSRNGMSNDGSTLTPGGSSVKLTGSKYYYTLKEGWSDVEFDEEIGDFVEIGDVWDFNYSDNYVALSADGKTLYLGIQPDQAYKVTYDTLTTIVSFRLAVRPGVTLESDSIRYINASERDALRQSFVIIMNDGANEYSYGGIDGENDFGIVDFTGDAGISGRPTVHAEAPTFTTLPQNADFYIDYTSEEDATLTAAAKVEDGGTVTYEWFKNTENKNEGGVSVGTGDKFTVPTDAELDAYYYVVATNTNNEVNGNKTASTASEAVHITVSKHPDRIAIENAQTALDAIEWADIAQATANTEDAVRAIIEEIAKAAVNNENVAIEVAISDFRAAVAGSADTTHEGEDGFAKFTVTATIGKEAYTLSENTVAIIATYFDGATHKEIIADAQSKLDAIEWADIAQETANTQSDVEAFLKKIAEDAIANEDVSVVVLIDTFVPATAGSASTTHEGVNGEVKFFVKAYIGKEIYTLDLKSVNIIATYFDGQLDSEAIAEAQTKLEAITWENIAQADANTEEAVAAYIESIAKAAVSNDKITIKAEVTAFTAAVAGSAATTHEGTNGTATFTVTATIGDEAYSVGATVAIIATYFDGVLDIDAVNAALSVIEAITWEDVAQADANTEDAVRAIIEEIANAAVTDESVTVKVEIIGFTAAVAGSAATTHEGTNGEVSFAVVLSRGDACEARVTFFNIIATYYDGVLDSEAVADAKAKLDAIKWSDIAQADANTEEAVKAYIEAIAKAAVNNENVTLEVEILDGDAAVAGSAATTHEGTNGYVEFKIKATCGAETAYAEADEFAIIATYFDGLLNSEAVADAKAKLDAITWSDIAQADANTEEAVKAVIEAIVKDTLKNDKLTIEVVISDFEEAVAGSASTTHEGTDGYAKFSVKVSLGEESYTLSAQEVAIIATYFDGVLDSEAIAEAQTKLNAITWADIAQEDANTEDAVKAIIEAIVKNELKNDNLTIEVVISDFTVAVAGSAATTHEGEDGYAKFSVKVSLGDESYTLSAQEVAIIATYFDGVLDSEAIAEAETKLNAITWADIAQKDANTEDAVKAIIEAIVKNELKNDKLTIEVVISDFEAAVAGSAATTHEGEDGYAKFSVKVSLGDESYTLSAQEVAIIATYFDGVLDSEAIAEAETKLNAITWADIAQKDANTEDAVKAIIEAIVKNELKNDKLTIEVVISDFTVAVAGSAATTHEGEDGYAKFSVKVSLGDESYTLSAQEVAIIATYFDGVLDSEAIAEAQTKLEALTWEDIAQEDANDEDAVKAIIEAIVKDTLKNDKLTIEVTISDFTAAVAGSASTTHEGTDGYAKFSVKVSLGDESYTLADQNVNIIATYFDGVLDSEAIAEAETKLNAITWADIAQEDANTEDAVKAILEAIVKDTLKNDKLTIEVTISNFTAAVAGSAATSHEGEDGYAKFSVKVSLGEESYTLSAQEVAIIATYFDGVLDSEAIAEAETKLNAITWADIAQADANTEEDVRAILEEIVKDTLKNDKLTIEVTISDFEEAVAGSAATTHEGEDGYAKFSVKVSLGEESYTLADQNVNIIATYFDGVLDADAIEEIKQILDNAVWEYISQAEANTEETVKAFLEAVAAEMIGNDNVKIEVIIDEFKAAIEGSADTTHEGTNGFAKFSVTATIGSESYTVSGQQVAILATIFEGILDSESVADAYDKVIGGEVTVKIRATEDEIEEAVAEYIRTLMTGDAEGVAVSVSREGESAFKVTLTKGGASAEKTIEMTITEEEPTKLQTPTGLSFNKGIAAWGKVENASGYTVNLYSIKGDTVTLIKTVEVDTNKYDFTADVRDNTSYIFDVTANGDGVYFIDSDASDDSPIYKKDNNSVVNKVVADMLAMRNRRFNITASAGVGGSISDEGVSRVKFGLAKTYTITANDGYAIAAVIVDGEDIGAVSEYRFTNVRAKHTIHVIFEKIEEEWKNPFEDIFESDTYYDAIRFVYENGLFKGTSETEFEPATTMTRAMFVTVLWRLEGEPVVNYYMQYDDVEAETWYTEAVRWASAEGIVNGYGDGVFGVDDEITVEQAAVIIARYAAYTDNYAAADINLKNFADGEFVSYWAKDQMMWALDNGIYESVAGFIRPQAAASRALVAEMFYRYVVAYGK